MRHKWSEVSERKSVPVVTTFVSVVTTLSKVKFSTLGMAVRSLQGM